MRLDTQPGDKVVFLATGGYIGDRSGAEAAGLIKNHEYTVKYIEVDSWKSHVVLEGFDGWHNTVMFANVTAAPAPAVDNREMFDHLTKIKRQLLDLQEDIKKLENILIR